MSQGKCTGPRLSASDITSTPTFRRPNPAQNPFASKPFFPSPLLPQITRRRRRRRPPARRYLTDQPSLPCPLFESGFTLVRISRSFAVQVAMLSLSRALGRRLFSSAAAASEGASATAAAAASTSVVRKAQNPLEEFFEVERSTQDDQPRPHYGIIQSLARSPPLPLPHSRGSRVFDGSA